MGDWFTFVDQLTSPFPFSLLILPSSSKFEPPLPVLWSTNGFYSPPENGNRRRRIRFTLQAIAQSPNSHTCLSLPLICAYRFDCFCIQSTRVSYSTGPYQCLWRWSCVPHLQSDLRFVQRSNIQVSFAVRKVINCFSYSFRHFLEVLWLILNVSAIDWCRYVSTPWLSSPHLQTILLNLLVKTPSFSYKR